MAAEQPAIAVDPAVRRLLGDISTGAERFAEGRVERILSLVVGIGSAVMGVQAFLNALGSLQEHPRWHVPLMVVVFAPLAMMIVALLTGLSARAGAAAFALTFPLALLCWPVVTAGRAAYAPGEPWVWYPLNIATVAAVMAFRVPLQIAWALAVPLLYGGVRLVQVGGGADQVTRVVLDVVFAMILAVVLLSLGWILRSTAVTTDAARREAVASYAAAAAADAIEQERVAVAALMHDSVLAALIAAERADSDRERSLAVSMAREALTRLANADQDPGEGSDEPVDPAAIVRGLQSAAAELGAGVIIEAHLDAAAPAVPGRVARALVLAAMQALANSAQHAAGSDVRGEVIADHAGIRIRLSDTGGGFDPTAVPDDRLGIRGSIVARIAAVGGSANVHSDDSGTVVTLAWEHAR
ncbi:ATP-binding protein [Microbacterium sp.]|uniref:sensor histidine kinase n=1 Tax=Microbacterium sp. TaxID=51671 RepID=UPI0025CE6BBC|nr:ATP-binding protein [Microbacterium sp.]